MHRFIQIASQHVFSNKKNFTPTKKNEIYSQIKQENALLLILS